jgi:hypothetical protein
MTLLLPHPEHETQRLVVHRTHPLNCETSIPALTGGTVPTAQFYVRNHFAAPAVNPATWRLRVRGLVKRPLSLSLHDLQAMPLQSQVVTLECAGNGRSLLDPRTEGEQWGLGAVSTAEWTGLPLAAVLDRAGVHPSARHLLFRGADRGTVWNSAQPAPAPAAATPPSGGRRGGNRGRRRPHGRRCIPSAPGDRHRRGAGQDHCRRPLLPAPAGVGHSSPATHAANLAPAR